jgi:hypothetical protein
MHIAAAAKACIRHIPRTFHTIMGHRYYSIDSPEPILQGHREAQVNVVRPESVRVIDSFPSGTSCESNNSRTTIQPTPVDLVTKALLTTFDGLANEAVVASAHSIG